jgi:hypothetical protein
MYYKLMKSERTSRVQAEAMFRPYEQTEVGRYVVFDEAVSACAKANRKLDVRHYVMNDSGKEYYAGGWID